MSFALLTHVQCHDYFILASLELQSRTKWEKVSIPATSLIPEGWDHFPRSTAEPTPGAVPSLQFITSRQSCSMTIATKLSGWTSQ